MPDACYNDLLFSKKSVCKPVPGHQTELLSQNNTDQCSAALIDHTLQSFLELSDRFVAEGNLTTLMVTHNMKDAIAHGNRLIMMNAGKIVFDVSGEEKKRLTVDDLLHAFTLSTAEEFANDRILLS